MTDRVVFHLPEGEEAYGRRALRDLRNLLDDETVEVDVALVANGGGVVHLLADAPTAGTVRESLASDVGVCACRNTLENDDDLAADDLVGGVTVVSSGMGELTRRRADGYAYVRP